MIEILLVPENVFGAVVGIGDKELVTVCDIVIELLLVPLKVIGCVVGILVLDNVINIDGVSVILLLPLNVIGCVVGIAELDIVFWLEELDDILNDILDELELIILFVEFGLLEFKCIPYGGSNEFVNELVIEIVWDNDW